VNSNTPVKINFPENIKFQSSNSISRLKELREIQQKSCEEIFRFEIDIGSVPNESAVEFTSIMDG